MSSTKYALQCTCGNICWVSKTQAGERHQCIAYGGETGVPAFSQLKNLPFIDASPLGIIEYKIRNQEPPFDGSCQSCATARSEVIFPVQFDYVPADEMVSPDSEASIRCSVIPFYFCHSCFLAFNRSRWQGWVRQLVDVLLHSFWLLVGLIAASIIAIALPVVGTGFVFAVLGGLYFQLTRKNCNPAIAKHIQRNCGLGGLTKDFYYCRLRPQHVSKVRL